MLLCSTTNLPTIIRGINKSNTIHCSQYYIQQMLNSVNSTLCFWNNPISNFSSLKANFYQEWILICWKCVHKEHGAETNKISKAIFHISRNLYAMFCKTELSSYYTVSFPHFIVLWLGSRNILVFHTTIEKIEFKKNLIFKWL